MRSNTRFPIGPFVIGLLLVAGVGHSQVARISEHQTGMLQIDASPDDTLEIDLSADLGRHRATGRLSRGTILGGPRRAQRSGA